MNYTPSKKVGYGVAVGGAVTILAWVAKDFFGVAVPGEVQGAVQMLAVFCTQWWVPDTPS